MNLFDYKVLQHVLEEVQRAGLEEDCSLQATETDGLARCRRLAYRRATSTL
jgi:hypothetical protein